MDRLAAWCWRRERDDLIRAAVGRRELLDHGLRVRQRDLDRAYRRSWGLREFIGAGFVVAGGAFPTTSVIDPFTQADGPLSASWTTPLFTGDNTLRVLSNECARSAGGGSFGNAYWNVATFGPDCEVYGTGTVKPSSGLYIGLWLRTTSPSTATPDAYFGEIRDGANQEINIVNDGVFATLGASVPQAWAAGDKWGLEAIGDQIVLYLFSGGSWTAIITRTDATYSAAGNIGLEIDGTAARWDAFGGGTVVPAPSAPGPPLLTVRAPRFVTR